MQGFRPSPSGRPSASAPDLAGFSRLIPSALFVLAILLSPDPVRAEFAQVTDDLAIHYESAGHGSSPMVFVPGWTMSSAVFVHQFEHFAESKQFTFISFDPRSQGISSHTSGGNHYEQHGRDLHAFMTKLNLHGVVLAGWSNGAFDILSYLHQFGSANLKALILIDGTPKGSGGDNQKEWVWFRYDDADHYRQSLTLGVLRDREKLNEEFADWMVEKPSPAYRAWITGITNQTSDDVAALLNENSAYMDFEADLQAADGKLPLLYVTSADKGSAALAWAKAHTPHAEVHALGRHLMFWERPDQFNAILDEFLRSLP